MRIDWGEEGLGNASKRAPSLSASQAQCCWKAWRTSSSHQLDRRQQWAPFACLQFHIVPGCSCALSRGGKASRRCTEGWLKLHNASSKLLALQSKVSCSAWLCTVNAMGQLQACSKGRAEAQQEEAHLEGWAKWAFHKIMERQSSTISEIRTSAVGRGQ